MKPFPMRRGLAGKSRKLALVLVVVALPLLLGWKLGMDKGINPRLVDRIEDGKTKRHEILTWFGDPKEIQRLPDGMIYVYKNFRPKNEPPRRKTKEPISESIDPNALDQKAPALKTSSEAPPEELAKTLIIRFKPDGETVQNHDYKEY